MLGCIGHRKNEYDETRRKKLSLVQELHQNIFVWTDRHFNHEKPLAILKSAHFIR